MENWGRELSDWESVAEPGLHSCFHWSIFSLFCLVACHRAASLWKGGLDNCRQQQGCGDCPKFHSDQYWGVASVACRTGCVIHGMMLKQIFRASSRAGTATHEIVAKRSLI